MYFIAVRLVESYSSVESMVQVYVNNTWAWVSADQWNKKNTEVVCRMMNISGSLSTTPANNTKNNEQKNQIMLMNNFQCTGHETSLLSCTHGRWNPDHTSRKRIARVICKNKKGKGIEIEFLTFVAKILFSQAFIMPEGT